MAERSSGQPSLEHVKDEVMAPVVRPIARIVVMPLAVVDRNLHFRSVPMVHAIAAAVVFATVEVLWIVHVWVVIESTVVTVARGSSPRPAVGLLSLLRVGL